MPLAKQQKFDFQLFQTPSFPFRSDAISILFVSHKSKMKLWKASECKVLQGVSDAGLGDQLPGIFRGPSKILRRTHWRNMDLLHRASRIDGSLVFTSKLHQNACCEFISGSNVNPGDYTSEEIQSVILYSLQNLGD